MPTPPRLVTAAGKTQSILAWSEQTGVPVATIRSRLDLLGWPAGRAVSVRPDKRFRKGGRTPAAAPRPCPLLRRDRGRAFVRWRAHGRNHYRVMGAWGSTAARAAYAAFAAEWASGGVSPPARGGRVCVSEVAVAWVTHCGAEYRKLGRRTSEYHVCRAAARGANTLYGPAPAAEFTPDRLRAVRDGWVRAGLSRKTVNEYAARLVRMLGWAAGRGMVPASVPAALREVGPLKAGRTAAGEGRRKGAVSDADIGKTIAALPDTPRGAVVGAMIRVQRLLGCRPQHLAGMRAGDVDRSHSPWAYTPPDAATKTLHLGKRVTYFLGPKAQAALGPLPAGKAGADHVFSYRRGVRVYAVTVRGYARAVELAARKAGVPHWSPHQIRRAAATAAALAAGSMRAAADLIGDHPDTAARHYVTSDPSAAARAAWAAANG